tara:strand:+ start:721 stop:894 length:174 start_codon:yes stop_codon:yes gene_type:complete
LGIQISKYWNQKPDWFSSLPRNEKQKLLAVYRIENESSEDRKKRRYNYQKRRLNESS